MTEPDVFVVGNFKIEIEKCAMDPTTIRVTDTFYPAETLRWIESGGMIAMMTFMSKKSPYQDKKYPERSSDVFVTQKMLYAVRDELKDDIKTSSYRLEAKISDLGAKISELSAQMNRHLALRKDYSARLKRIFESSGNQT